jgi:pimeloyl-ACP methyl ester carboxylesterase
MSVLKSFAGGRLFGGAWGTGTPTVLALHGWRRDHHDFAGVFEASPAGAPAAIAPDLPGFGSAPPPPEPWGTMEYAQHLLPIFTERGALADRVTVVGHSFGGRVAVRLAGLVPDRVDRLVLTGVPLLERAGRKSRPAARYRLVRGLHRLGLVGEARLEAARLRHGSPDYVAAQGVMRGVFVEVLGEDYARDLEALRCPVQLVWGEEDAEVPLEVAVRAEHVLRRATLITLPGIGHLTPTEAPGALAGVIVDGVGASSGPEPGGGVADPARGSS